ncbi:hypothetical protein ONZ45_g11493 [Pleurotus djamor]|nr:hypothetical protein ONZ45_g11493 [Pleurotus djamor]
MEIMDVKSIYAEDEEGSQRVRTLPQYPEDESEARDAQLEPPPLPSNSVPWQPQPFLHSTMDVSLAGLGEDAARKTLLCPPHCHDLRCPRAPSHRSSHRLPPGHNSPP